MRVWLDSSSVLHAEGRVLLGQALEGDRHLVLVGLRLRLDGQLDDRLGEGDRLQHDRLVLGRQRVAGGRVLEADRGGDVAGADLVDLLAVVGVHLEDAADPLLVALRAVEHVRAGLERARVDPEERELADERVGDDLEGQGRERRVGIGLEGHVFAGARVAPGDRRHVERAGQEVDDRVEHRLDALVLQRRTGQHRDDLVGQRAGANRAAELVGADLLALEELVRDVVVEVGQRLDELLAPLGGERQDVGGDVPDLDLVAEVVAVGDRLHVDEVDDAAERALGADRHLERHRR